MWLYFPMLSLGHLFNVFTKPFYQSHSSSKSHCAYIILTVCVIAMSLQLYYNRHPMSGFLLSKCINLPSVSYLVINICNNKETHYPDDSILRLITLQEHNFQHSKKRLFYFFGLAKPNSNFVSCLAALRCH